MRKSPHITSLANVRPMFENDLGSVTMVDEKVMPILDKLSLKRLFLEPGAIREPQWNINANQLAYCVSGTVLVSILGNLDTFASFIVRPGEMYHVESGAVYHIENIGDDRAELVLALRNERPQHFSVRDSFTAMTDAVLGNTFDLQASAFKNFERSPAQQIVRRNGSLDVPSNAGLPNARLFDIESQAPVLTYSYGDARMARSQFWAALDDISMYSLRVRESGMREPHWHPVTAEMGYVAKGHARMRVLDPDLSMDEYLLGPGDVYFVPRAYPHHIEVIGDEEIHFLIFFDQPMPADIGYRATATAFSREVLAASFAIPERELPQFPFTPVDPLFVKRVNPSDPVSK
ncbi:cupin domain-containing protein [Herbidospora sp. RD11066]